MTVGAHGTMNRFVVCTHDTWNHFVVNFARTVAVVADTGACGSKDRSAPPAAGGTARAGGGQQVSAGAASTSGRCRGRGAAAAAGRRADERGRPAGAAAPPHGGADGSCTAAGPVWVTEHPVHGVLCNWQTRETYSLMGCQGIWAVRRGPRRTACGLCAESGGSDAALNLAMPTPGRASVLFCTLDGAARAVTPASRPG